MEAIIVLTEILQNQLNWNKQRIDFLAKFIITLIKVGTVNLAIIAESFAGNAKIESHYKREFRIRVRQNFKVPNRNGKNMSVKLLFRNLDI